MHVECQLPSIVVFPQTIDVPHSTIGGFSNLLMVGGMAVKVLSIEKTPNPNAIKIVVDQTVSTVPRSFRTKESASDHDLSRALFALPGVTGVFCLHDFVTISKSPEARWADITSKARRIISKANPPAAT